MCYVVESTTQFNAKKKMEECHVACVHCGSHATKAIVLWTFNTEHLFSKFRVRCSSCGKEFWVSER